VQGLVDRRGDAKLGAAPENVTVQVVDLGTPAAREILRGRRPGLRHRVGQPARRVDEIARRHLYAGGARDFEHLAHGQFH